MDESRLKDESFSKVDKDKVETTPGRPKGHPKTGGRTKGTPNKSTTAWTNILDGEGFNIAEEAIRLYFDEDTNNQLRFHILQFLSQYTTASIKPKEVSEETSSVDQPQTDILKVIK